MWRSPRTALWRQLPVREGVFQAAQQGGSICGEGECLVFSVTLTPSFRSTDLGEPFKYNLFKNLRAENAL
jgi:hypothetical protein